MATAPSASRFLRSISIYDAPLGFIVDLSSGPCQGYVNIKAEMRALQTEVVHAL